MDYLITFLEGIISFISPCVLPMLPVYLLYFAGDGGGGRKKTIEGAIGFVSGFTAVFVAMGAFASAVGGFLTQYRSLINIITGALVVLFGVGFAAGWNWGGLFSRRGRFAAMNTKPYGFFRAALFGVIFSVGWTPCVGAFLGSALLLASQQGVAVKGVALLFCYSLGLGLPFILSAMIIDLMKSAFGFIKRNYKVINLICGILLVIVGVLMMTGTVSI